MPPMPEPTREQAWELVCEWVQSDSLRKHLLGVEAAMRGYARRYDADEELWGVTGLVHDLDYERFPDLDDEENGHPRSALRLFAELGWPQELIDAVAGHAPFLGVPRETDLAKVLFAVDELSGFITACALVRPTGIEGLKPKSVKKKLKQPSFAAAVNRDEVRAGSRGARRRVRRPHHVRDRGDGGARRRARARAARGAGLGTMRARNEDRPRAARRAGRAAGDQHDRRRQPDEGRRGDDRGRGAARAAGWRDPGTRRGPERRRRRGRRPDRPPALLRDARCTGGTSSRRCSPRSTA